MPPPHSMGMQQVYPSNMIFSTSRNIMPISHPSQIPPPPLFQSDIAGETVSFLIKNLIGFMLILEFSSHRTDFYLEINFTNSSWIWEWATWDAAPNKEQYEILMSQKCEQKLRLRRKVLKKTWKKMLWIFKEFFSPLDCWKLKKIIFTRRH